ncbi:MAG: DUF1036 domain-containing protein [Alphaproteobacteria bacterium]
MNIRNGAYSGLSRLLAGAALCTVFSLGYSGTAVADGVDADDVVAALAREGYPVDLGEDAFGDPDIESAAGDTLFEVLFFDCDGDVCDTIMFTTAYVSNSVTVEDMRDWNSNNLHGQAYLDDEDDPNLDFTILAAGGLTSANLRQIVRQWGVSLAEFEDHIGWNSNSGGAAARTDGAAIASSTSTIEVCNDSGDGVSIAYATASGGTNSAGETLFRSEGWLNIEHDECIDVWEGPFENRYYYVYAEADDGEYSGDYFFCTLEDAFEIVDTQCSADYERNGFSQIDMAQGDRMEFGYVLVLDP